MPKTIIFALIMILSLAALTMACGDDDDDNDTDSDVDDDTDDINDDLNDDINDDINDDVNDDIDDDLNDDVDDDEDDDVDDDDIDIQPYVMVLQNAQINILEQTIDYERSFFSVGGSIHITQIGTTLLAPFEADLENVQFMECIVNWDTDEVQILQDGDTGLIVSDPVVGAVTPTPQKSYIDGDFFFNSGFGLAAAEEAFNFDPFEPCAGSTCSLIAYASISDIFAVQQFTQGPYSLNDWMVMWTFDGDTQAGDVLDLTMEITDDDDTMDDDTMDDDTMDDDTMDDDTMDDDTMDDDTMDDDTV